MNESFIYATPIMKADKPNSNNRIYPMAALEACVKRAGEKPLLGVIGMDESPHIPFDKVSHSCENVRIEGDTLVADIRVLKTPSGQQLAELYKAGVITFRTSGFGKIAADGKTITDWELVSINAVYDGAEL